MSLKNYTLSVLIPARNEEFLKKTIECLLKQKNPTTEIIVVLDGAWANPSLDSHEDLTIVYNHTPVGQRAATNQACRLSTAKYVMKLDAHCDIDKNFDIKMIEVFEKEGDNIVLVPVMRNLHAFNWVCKHGHARYQSPSGPCTHEDPETKKICGEPTTKDVVWIPKTNPMSRSYCFDSSPHFQYFDEYRKRPEYTQMLAEKNLTESMSIQGSCFMLSREKYWELNISDEEIGSWGSQGIEVACKFWLSGGRVLINHKVWYAHLFRTQGKDFGFPYEQKQSKVIEAKKKAKDLFFNGKWKGQKKPLYWLIEKFWPVKGWTEQDLKLLKEGKL